MLCLVCEEGQASDNNPVVACSSCALLAHAECYGWSKGSATCEPCRAAQSGADAPRCALCLTSGGALKPTVEGNKWCHVLCAYFCDGLEFDREETMHIVGVPQIDLGCVSRVATRLCSRFASSCVAQVPT